MSYIVTQESLDSLATCWAEPSHLLRWDSLFVLPPWLKAWWQELGAEAELYLSATRQEGKIIGIAPLLVREDKASLIGSADVCDSVDFVVAPGREQDFFSVLLKDLRYNGINQLDLGPLRPDSAVLTNLADIAEDQGHVVSCNPEDVSLEIELPSSWEEYLAILTSKQRHEVKRKLRRLSEAGKVDYHWVKDSDAIPAAMDTFLKMFAESREDKATFLTTKMASFLRSLAANMGQAGLLKLGVLELDAVPAAMVMCFDYDDCVYLYNSGYEPRYSSLSVGLLCKTLAIKESIEEGKKKFDLLKGDEPYKYHLGGVEVPLSRCQITIQ